MDSSKAVAVGAVVGGLAIATVLGIAVKNRPDRVDGRCQMRLPDGGTYEVINPKHTAADCMEVMVKMNQAMQSKPP